MVSTSLSYVQVHLELDPYQSLEEREGEALKSCDMARKEIIKDLLSTHLGLECNTGTGSSTVNTSTPAYFLGRHEVRTGDTSDERMTYVLMSGCLFVCLQLKQELLEKIKDQKEDGVLRVGNLSLKFCGKGETPPPVRNNFLPVLVHSCPRDFSTLEYFEVSR